MCFINYNKMNNRNFEINILFDITDGFQILFFSPSPFVTRLQVKKNNIFVTRVQVKKKNILLK